MSQAQRRASVSSLPRPRYVVRSSAMPSEVARMAGQQRHVAPPVQLLDDVIDQAAVVGDRACSAQTRCQICLYSSGSIGQELDLVAEAAQESLVGDVLRAQVGREHEDQVERHLEVMAPARHERVLPRVHRHDPAVEQHGRLDALAAEVVDQQEAVVGLELDWRGVGPRRAVELQLEHVGRELAAGEHDRALAGDIARVESLVEQRRRGGLLNASCSWQSGSKTSTTVSFTAMACGTSTRPLSTRGQLARGERLAGARVAVEEDRALRVQAGPSRSSSCVRDDHAGECVVNRLARDCGGRCTDCLRDERDVVGKRHRRRPDVAAARHGVVRLVPSLVGQAVAQFRIEALARTDFDAALGTHEIEDLVDDRAGERHAIDQLAGRQHAGRQRGACRAGRRGKSATSPFAQPWLDAARAGRAGGSPVKFRVLRLPCRRRCR